MFLLKQGLVPRGIIASGWLTSDSVTETPHFIPERATQGETTLQADVEFDRILSVEDAPLSVDDIPGVHWHTQSSGIEIGEAAAEELEARWASHLRETEGLRGGIELAPDDGDTEEPPYTPEAGDWRVAALRQIKARRGQQAFRTALRERYGDQCVISGCRLLDALEAAHIKPYRGRHDNHPANGLLLRADLHTLFDLNLVGIEPGTLTVHVHPKAQEQGYGEFEGVMLRCGQALPSAEAIASRWLAYQLRRRQP